MGFSVIFVSVVGIEPVITFIENSQSGHTIVH